MHKCGVRTASVAAIAIMLQAYSIAQDSSETVPFWLPAADDSSVAFFQPGRSKFPPICTVYDRSGNPLWTAAKTYSISGLIYSGGHKAVFLRSAGMGRSDDAPVVQVLVDGKAAASYSLKDLLGDDPRTSRDGKTKYSDSPLSRANAPANANTSSKRLIDTYSWAAGAARFSADRKQIEIPLAAGQVICLDQETGKILKRKQSNQPAADTGIPAPTYEDTLRSRGLAEPIAHLTSRMHRELVASHANENLLLAPFDLAASLSVLQLGAKGPTAEQLLAPLRDGDNAVALPDQFFPRLAVANELLQPLSLVGQQDNLGLDLSPANPAQPSLSVMAIEPTSPLASLLNKGDRLTAANDEPLNEGARFAAIVAASQELTLDVVRPDGSVTQIYLRLRHPGFPVFRSQSFLAAGKQVHFDPTLIETLTRSGMATTMTTPGQNEDDSIDSLSQKLAIATEGKLKDLLPAKIEAAPGSLVVATASHFKAGWQFCFAPSATDPNGTFTLMSGKTTKVPVMRGTFGIPYLADSKQQVLVAELPYQSSQFSLVLFVPQQPNGLRAFEEQLTGPLLHEWMNKLDQSAPQAVTIHMPKFSLMQRHSLVKSLSRLGVTAAFGPEADFSGLSNAKLQVAHFFQFSALEVNEEGTEAASATVATLQSIGATRPNAVRALHPFLFCVRDRSTGCILYWGRIADPSKT